MRYDTICRRLCIVSSYTRSINISIDIGILDSSSRMRKIRYDCMCVCVYVTGHDYLFVPTSMNGVWSCGMHTHKPPDQSIDRSIDTDLGRLDMPGGPEKVE